MDLAWIACCAVLWGLLVSMVWGFQRLEHNLKEDGAP